MADAIVVLGYKLDRDCELNHIAKYRAEKAVELFKGGVAPRIIFSGSHSFWTKDAPKFTEASVMADYAFSLGVLKKNILLEENSKDSIGNAYFLRKNYLDKNSWRDIIVVTSEFHVDKVKYVFSKVLGKKYSFNVEKVKSGLSKNRLEELMKREKKVIALLKGCFKDVKDGDMRAIKECLYSHHPAYAQNPDITTEDIQKNFAPFDVFRKL